MVPLVLFIFFASRGTSNKIEFSLLFLIFIFQIVLFHPLILFILICIFIIIEISIYIYNKINKNFSEAIQINHSFGAIIISIVSFFLWGAFVIVVIKNFMAIFGFIEGDTISQIQTYSNLAMGVNADWGYIAELIIVKYGQLLIFGALSFVAMLYLLNSIIKGNKIQFISILSIIGVFVMLILAFIISFSSSGFNFERISNVALFFSIFIIPLFIIPHLTASIHQKKRLKKLKNILIISILFIALISISIFNIYPSTINKIGSQQVVNSDLSGVQWFFNTRNSSIETFEQGISIYRYHVALYGVDYSENSIENIRYSSNTLPDHFGYPENISLSSSYSEEKYFILNNQGEFFYHDMYPEFIDYWRFNEQDYQRINVDTGVSMIYSNGDYRTYLIC